MSNSNAAQIQAARGRHRFARELDLLVVMVLLVVVTSILYPTTFFSESNLHGILNNLEVDGMVASGMMLLMVAGVFDLSVGSMQSMVGVITGYLLTKLGLPTPAAIVAGLAVAALGGWINGWLVSKVRVNALITTLATMSIFQGIAILIAGPSISNLPASFNYLGQGQFQHLRFPVYLMIGIALLAHFFLYHTRFGGQFYYVGSNAKAARLSGIPVEKLQCLGFIISGVIAGIAGLCFAARVGTAVSNVGLGSELKVITAVILGGASLSGGKGSIPGALIGVLFMALINNIVLITHVRSEWQGIVTGIILILAVAIDSYQNRTQV